MGKPVTRTDFLAQLTKQAARELKCRVTDEAAKSLAVQRLARINLREAVQNQMINGGVLGPETLTRVEALLRQDIPKSADALPTLRLKYIGTIERCPQCGYEQPERVPLSGADARGPVPQSPDATASEQKPRARIANVVELDRNRSRDIHHGDHAALKHSVSRDPNLGGFAQSPEQRDPHPADLALPIPEPAK
jgi:hypothetical protein